MLYSQVVLFFLFKEIYSYISRFWILQRHYLANDHSTSILSSTSFSGDCSYYTRVHVVLLILLVEVRG